MGEPTPIGSSPLMEKLNRALAPVYRSLYFPPAVIFAAIIIATVFAWHGAKESLDQDILAAASAKADSAEQNLREQMVTYEQVMHGSAGLLQSSDEVTRDEWERFLAAFNVDTDVAGVQSIGLLRVFDAAELPAITGFMARQGITDYQLQPKTNGQHAAILYIHTLDAAMSPPPGFDMYTEPSRRAAMVRASDDGHISMTPRLKLLPDKPGQPYGFNLFAPYYDPKLPAHTPEERRQALQGYIYAAFRTDIFFKNIIGSAASDNSAFQVMARSDDKTETMYESPTFETIQRRPRITQINREVGLYDQTWTLRFVADARTLVSNEQLARPELVLFFGVFSAALISMIVLLLIRARTLDLSSQKEQAVELAKDELLSLASHQLRTPATGVKQYVGMVLQGFAGKITTSQRNLLEKAYASNDRQLRIINEILHLAKIDAGRIVLAKQPTNLGELVTDIVNEQMPDVKNAKHKIKVKIPKQKEGLAVLADTHMLRMAVENVLSNAIKYTPAGGRIEVEISKEKGWANIRISDTGIGISPEDEDKVFRQFSRLPNEMSQQVGGTGIGLYLAKHLVELHKGKISLRSSPAKGSTFTISLPLRTDNEDE